MDEPHDLPTDQAPAPTSAPPAGPRRWGPAVAGSLLAPLRALRRRPGRALGVLFLLALIAVAAGIGGRAAWAAYHLRCARIEVDRGHNARALGHLKECRLVHPEGPEVLLLCARVSGRAR